MDRPIIFSAPMVRALLAGNKTMTRRLAWRDVPTTDGVYAGQITLRKASPWQKVQPGDRLWVRETWGGHWELGGELGRPPDHIIYKADHPVELVGWGPSIHMPRAYSRLTLLVTATKIERLQDISEADAKAEGVERMVMDSDGKFYLSAPAGSYRLGFAGLWSHLHGRESWDANPEVVALTFKVVAQNIDRIKAAA